MKMKQLLSATSLVGILVGFPTIATAQTVPSETTTTTLPEYDTTKDDSTTKDILVTGSRIPRPAFDGQIPGVTVTSEQIEARSFTNVLDALNDIPLVGPGASPFGNNGGQAASLGVSFVDLLDLGTQRTLTLVNGRRFVSGNAASLFVVANATGGQVDLNSLPIALIDRTDVLTVGGATAYGSDAISGVVNVILKNNFTGLRLGALAGVNAQGDGGGYRLSATVGTNFADDRGNIAASFEYVRDNALNGDQRINIARNFIAPISFRNGSVRNSGFTPAFDLSAAAGAFLPAASDLVPNNIAGRGFAGGSIIVAEAGAIFQSNANIAFLPANFQGVATTDPQSATLSPGFRAQALINQAGNTNLVPGTPIAVAQAGCSLTLASVCRFAPTALPGTGAAQQTAFAQLILTQFAPAFVAQGTQAQRNALALQVLQTRTPTPREFLAANPTTDVNAFIGSLIPNFLDVATTNVTTAGFLPRTAVPLQFDNAGNVVRINSGTITDPTDTPATTGGAVTPDGYNPARYTTLRVQQDRYVANFLGHFDILPNLTLYTENLFARIESLAPVNAASANTIASATTENVALVFNLNNPFLDANDRATLRAAGVTNNFVVSRSNQDIVGDNPAFSTSNTYRTVAGFKGNFDLFSRKLNYDVSFTYGRVDARGRSFQIKDIEYALAADAVQGPNGPVCGAQLNPAIIGTTPNGVVGLEVVREAGPDGIITERQLRRVVTTAQVAACRPLNLFGFGQSSAESRNYVLAETGFENTSQQYFAQGTIAGTIFDLPGGPFGFGATAEYRRESLSYSPDALSLVGATRSAALANTSGYIEAIEFSAETRIPIFGTDFNLPLLRNLELTPSVRFARQNGAAPDVRLLSGTVTNNESNGDLNTLFTLGGNWRPVRDLMIRGNVTRSIRQPSVVELFLGGQPAFTAVTDPCSTAQINLGIAPATRRSNCVAAVIAANLATDTASATTFLNNYVPSGSAVSGSFTGSPSLRPERGESFTVGAVLTPNYLKGLSLSADYIDVTIRDQIIPTTIVTALQVCYDSPNFPDTANSIGTNVCSFFNRIAAGQTRAFEVDNNFSSGFINLGALRVRAINSTLLYRMPLADWFNNAKVGSFELYTNTYYTLSYESSSNGRFTDTQRSDGAFGRPKIKLQVRGRYDRDNFFTQWVWNWSSATQLFSGGAPVAGTNAQNEVQDLIRLPSIAIHNASIGMFIGKNRKFSLQFTINNLFDTQYVGGLSQAFGFGSGRVDDLGRRLLISANARF